MHFFDHVRASDSEVCMNCAKIMAGGRTQSCVELPWPTPLPVVFMNLVFMKLGAGGAVCVTASNSTITILLAVPTQIDQT